jgi:cyclopropane fatty-acyl-phospholipid synthase-like methyltransferase
VNTAAGEQSPAGENVWASITDTAYRGKFIGTVDVIADWVADYGGIAGKDVLDFGCGEGTMAMGIALRQQPRRIVAVDTHAEIDNCLPFARRELGLETLPANLELKKIDPDSDLAELGRFDLIYSWSVFEHVNQNLILDRFLKIRRAMKPTGLMFLQTTPLYYSAKGSHLTPWIPEPWAHLLMQRSELYDRLRAKLPSASEVSEVQHVFETLNKTTAPALLRAARAAGFKILREYETQDEEEPPSALLEIFHRDTLTTNQLVFLASCV